MIYKAIQQFCETPENAAKLALVGDDGVRWSYGELLRVADAVAEYVAEEMAKLAPNINTDAYQQNDCGVGVAVQNVPTYLAVLLGLDRVGATALIRSAASGPQEIDREAAKLHQMMLLSDVPGRDTSLQACLGNDPTGTKSSCSTAVCPIPPRSQKDSSRSANNAEIARQTGLVVLLTSGTSGPPKLAVHTWQSLAAPVRREGIFCSRTWLLSYNHAKFAGLQVILQSLLSGGCLAVPKDLTPQAIARCLMEHHVEFASGTPTFWRMFLQGTSPEELAGGALSYITLGGEAVDQPLLNGLQTTFPKTRISHIYASTEMGACFSVNDGKAGFPLAYLDKEGLPCRLRISKIGELEIQSQRAMSGYLGSEEKEKKDDAGAWFQTGDLVEVRDDRVFFVGRKSDTINVGGNKVFPLEVEAVIRSLPGIDEVRVYGIPSPLVGQLVAAEIQPASDADPKALEQAAFQLCRKQLAKYKVPAIIQFCDQMPVTAAGKLSRKKREKHV